jgi:hypothetical protein
MVYEYIPTSVLDRYFEGRVKYNSVRNVLAGREKIAPAEIFRVDPDSITRSITWNELGDKADLPEPEYFDRSKYKIAGTVLDGEWDLVDREFADSVVHRSFVDHFDRGVSWQETDLYNEAIERISKGERWWRCSTREGFERRCRKLDRLYDTIREDGYETQRELLSRSTATLKQRGARNRNPYQIVKSEIAVDIGRDGDLIFQDGRNRLSIAKILELDTIPVVVLVRHERWQRLRDEIIEGRVEPTKLSDDLRSHPDVPQNVCDE